MTLQSFPVLIIPAYNPDNLLVDLLEKHTALNNGQACIVVNDGSHPASAPIFQRVQALGCLVLHHDKNQGKGAALKTAMNYYLTHMAETSTGVITADADGQHSLEDIIRLSCAFVQDNNVLYLGTRKTSQANTPLRSRIGNRVTKWIFNCLTHNRIEDTQTGLRAIPNELIRYLVVTKTDRYEFEFEMFFIAQKHRIAIKQLPIATIYINNNKGSHFNPLWDSLRIYFIFIRFCSVSLLSFILDFTLFTALFLLSGRSGLSVFGARLCSVPFNFYLNKSLTFKSKGSVAISAFYYLNLALIIGYSSFQLMTALHHAGLNIYCSKMLAEFLIFVANFFIQYWIVFARRNELVGVS